MSNHNVTDAFTVVHPITLERGAGARVWDSDGREYIDFVGGIGVLNFGHCHPAIVSAIHEQTDKMTHYAYNAVHHKPYQDYMPRLCSITPITGDVAGMLTNSGAESCENALKIVRQKTGRAGVIAFDGAFHGRTLAAVNLNGKVAPYKSALGTLSAGVYHIPYPSTDTGVSCDDAILALERLISVEVDVSSIGAVIIEPVQGEGGFLALDKDFAKYLRAFCDKHGIILIFDEIQSGFGRCGVPFATSFTDIEPDLILFAKSMGGGLPLGAVVGRASLVNGLIKGSLGGTYSGNPVACAAALAVLDIMADDGTWQAAKDYENTLTDTIALWQKQQILPWLDGLTGIGAMRGIRLSHAKHGTHANVMNYILKVAREKGLLLMPSGKYRHIIRLLPPINIDKDTLNQGLAILKEVLASLPDDPNDIVA
ncbi:aminotransferase class III-fold pyridoxal phosphate-dependent enzyme [Moraxella nasovis]|uniref:2-aminoadipate transaminase n=1 Tax=Moraxella nasovis TaxID=2904121 RepID=UPI001F6233A0|nr:aminotransferase class III-fold pyridoxal phosphate-dependent enzyme [Moraxella nasovis]UNU72663.1 aminotransferase class III-fold pyridoxal phosphate-dependent enzyme [Moraxella nasovis]